MNELIDERMSKAILVEYSKSPVTYLIFLSFKMLVPNGRNVGDVTQMINHLSSICLVYVISSIVLMTLPPSTAGTSEHCLKWPNP